MDNRHPEISTLTLRLQKKMIMDIDSVSRDCRMNRTQWIRRALARNLAYSIEHELPILDDPKIQAVLTP
jgi:hypothetical protein